MNITFMGRKYEAKKIEEDGFKNPSLEENPRKNIYTVFFESWGHYWHANALILLRGDSCLKDPR